MTDVRAVREDPDLAHPDYEGEYVVSSELTYLILRNGQVVTVGTTADVLRASALHESDQPPGEQR